MDIDLERFFDNVPQDRLRSLVHNVINDGDTESLIRKYLKAGAMTPEGYEETKLGIPQGSNLSPLLSNIMLNELDKELEARRLRFTRYADDVEPPYAERHVRWCERGDLISPTRFRTLFNVLKICCLC